MASKTQNVEVLRAFWHKQEPYAKGSVLELPTPVAIDLRSAGKVRFVASDVKSKHNKDVPPPVDARGTGESFDNGQKQASAK